MLKSDCQGRFWRVWLIFYIIYPIFKKGLLSGAAKPSFCVYLLQIIYDECHVHVGVHWELPYMLDCYSCSTWRINLFFCQYTSKFLCLGRCAAYETFQHAEAVMGRSEGDMKRKIGLLPLNCGYQVEFWDRDF